MRFFICLFTIMGLCAPVAAESPAKVNALGRQAAKLRQLSYKPITSKVVTQKQASAYVLRLLKKEMKGKEVDVREALVKHLGLMPMKTSSRALYRKLYASQVRGLYDPAKKVYLVVNGAGTGSSPELDQMAKMAGLDITSMYTIHELGHAIQDQHFNLQKISKKVHSNFDRGFAAQSLIEGDASLLMMHSALAQLGMSPADMAGLGGGLGGDPSMMGMGDPALAAAPTYFRESLTQPYTQGMTFASALHAKGGWASVNAAFRQLPTTSEQIFHPEKYFRREKPKKVSKTGIPSQLGGYKFLGADRAGEFTARIMELETSGIAGVASAGWGGDRYWVFKKGKSTFVIWRTTWDSENDAREFETLTRQTLAKMGKAKGKNRWLKGSKVYSYTRKGRTLNMLLGVPVKLEKTLGKS